MSKQKKKKKKQKKKKKSNVAINLAWLTFLFMMVVIGLYYLNDTLSCESEYAVVTGVKSASSGGMLTNDLCVYETTVGDVTSSECYHDEGDRIVTGWNCN